MNLNSLRSINTISINELTDSRFSKYGRILQGYNCINLIALADKTTSIDCEKNTYITSVYAYEADPAIVDISNSIFGGMPVQAGYCNGPNSSLNALEYHKTPEVFIAVTDCVQFLGRAEDITDYRSYETSKTEAFFFPAGCVVECFPHTLHFSPCKSEPTGFKSIIILPTGTNNPFEKTESNKSDPETRLLFMKNKWLLAHSERIALIDRGAFPGLIGVNLQINTLAR